MLLLRSERLGAQVETLCARLRPSERLLTGEAGAGDCGLPGGRIARGYCVFISRYWTPLRGGASLIAETSGTPPEYEEKGNSVRTDTRYGVGEAFQVMRDVVTFHATAEQTDDELLAFQVEVGPGGGPPPLHTHEAAEFFWTLKGDLSYFRQEENGDIVEITGGAGTHAFIPSNVPHTYRNLSGEPAAYLGILSPGRSMQDFLLEVARDVGSEPLSPEFVLRTGASFGVVTLDIVPGEQSRG